jgi:hypothetical protein
MEILEKKVTAKNIKINEDISLNSEINKYLDIVKSYYSGLGNSNTTEAAEKYIELSLYKILKGTKFIKIYKDIKVRIKELTIDRNYADFQICIYFYTNYTLEKANGYSQAMNMSMRELYRNCSSIVFTNYNDGSIKYNLENHDSIKKTEEFTANLFDVFIELAKAIKYSVALYTASLQENSTYLIKYLENNWDCIKEFKNKRNNNSIKYFTKDL